MNFIKLYCSLLLITSFLIHGTCPIVLQGLQKTDATCNGASDGTVIVEATGGLDTLQYSIDGGSTYTTSPIFTGFAAGTYTLDVWVQDLVCSTTSAIFQITINQPPALVISSVSKVNNTCNGGNTGRITVTASGGTAPLQYSIDNGTTYTTSNIFNALAAGNYYVKVQDAHLCEHTYSVNPVAITEPTAISVAVTTTNVSCHGLSDGIINIIASGGTGALQYSINGGSLFVSSPLFTGLSGGSYTVQVKDANNCIVPYSGNPVIIVDPTLPTITSVSHTDATCFAGSNGTITITGATGGTPPYTYAINDAGYQSSPIFTGFIAGNSYHADIKDANGCETAYAGNPIIISQPTKIVFDVAESGACGPAPAQGTITILT